MTDTTESGEATSTSQAVYSLEGTLLEACSCGVLCPCWVGEDPDGGECFAFLAHHFDSGQIEGIDVGGLSMATVAHVPGNVLEGNWRVVVFVDDQADDRQKDAIVRAFTGQLGGPLADLAALMGDVSGPYSVPIRHEIVEGKGTLQVGTVIEAEIEPYLGPDGSVTTLRESIFSTVPGSPA